jgi:hypothetical protein
MGSKQEKFPNEPILKILKSLSINNKYQKTNFRIAKSTTAAYLNSPFSFHWSRLVGSVSIYLNLPQGRMEWNLCASVAPIFWSNQVQASQGSPRSTW